MTSDEATSFVQGCELINACISPHSECFQKKGSHI